MGIIFDGREFAKKKEEVLQNKVRTLAKQGIIPKLDSIIVGDDPASILYQNLKKKAAERIGAEVRIKTYDNNTTKEKLLDEIRKLNNFPSVNGIMIQLPLPKNFSKNGRQEIIDAINAKKDVDGLRKDSVFIPPTAKAVLSIIEEVEEFVHFKDYPIRFLVVGGSGFIGRQIVRAIRNLHLNSYYLTVANSKTENLKELALSADILISVTGKPDLIKANMVKERSVLIDVGSPKGDIEKAAYGKAAFVSPVPGGVGPVTISSLMENLVEAAENK